MAKFIIECPECHSYAEANSGLFGTGLFAKKQIKCKCGNSINVKTDKFAARVCPSCKNSVIFDQSKGDKAICPVCKKPLNTAESLNNTVEFVCPTCSCNLAADRSAANYTCPMCDTKIDVQKEVKKREERNKGLASVVKYEGNNQTLVWKHPIEDFNLGSQLIVHESQEALFFRDGQALDLFGPGRYTLATQNLPILENIYKLPTNADTIFHSEVYFINKTVQMGVKWGTDSRVRYIDPESGIPFDIGASGQFNIRVSDARKLVVKLVGTANEFNWNDVEANGYYSINTSISKFRAMIMTVVKSNLSRIIKENHISIFEIDASLDLISDKLCEVVNRNMEDYGLEIPAFYVTTILEPEDENFTELKKQHAEMYLRANREKVLKAEAEAAMARKTVEAETAAKLKVIGAQGEAEAYKLQAEAEAAEMRLKGYTYQQETARQVGVGAVEHMGGGSGEGGGGLAGIAGLGVSLGAMGSVMNLTKDALNPAVQGMTGIAQGVGSQIGGTWNCTCGAANISTPFCPQCGKSKPSDTNTWSCKCGASNITTPFCPQCGSPKPVSTGTWNCKCGASNIATPFCPQCGAPKPEDKSGWDCVCGKTDIMTPFCPQCGKPKPAETDNGGNE